MVVSALFKEETPNSTAPGTRKICFWLHQPTRLTDGHIVLQEDGTSKTVVNLSTKGKPFEISARARHDNSMRREDAGMAEWDDVQIAALLADLEIDQASASPVEAFADAVIAPIRAAERSAAKHLSIQWDVEERDIPEAISLRYQVVQKAEAILNDAGLLVDQDGTCVSDETISATLEVSEFDAAKALLWSALNAEDRRYACRIDEA